MANLKRGKPAPKPAATAKPAPVTVWLSRDDSFDVPGLAPVVDVWNRRPERYTFTDDGLVVWLWPDGGDGPEEITVAECLARYHVIPETNLELIRVGPDVQ